MDGLQPVYYTSDESSILTNGNDAEVADAEPINDKSGYRIPDSSLWKSLARGTPSSTYSGSNTASDVAWYNTSSTHPVGEKDANSYGLNDMSGNVWEYVFTDTSSKLSFGGAYNSSEDDVAISSYDTPAYTNKSNKRGFRVIRE